MTDLHTKLRKILLEMSVDIIDPLAADAEPINEATTQIEQVFKDAGWADTRKQFTNMLTGPEWYDRFSKELVNHAADRFTSTQQKSVDEGRRDEAVIDICLQAAKRASGVKDGL